MSVTGPGQGEPVIAFVVAMAENRVIGRQGAMPWHLSSDLRTFRRLTLDKPIVMGRKTFESIGRVLDRRTSIVVTRARFAAGGDPRLVWADSVGAALGKARDIALRDGVQEIMVIGGGEIYAQALPLASRIYLTIVHAELEGDTAFPPLGDEWREVHRESLPRLEGDTNSATFTVLERSAGARTPIPA